MGLFIFLVRFFNRRVRFNGPTLRIRIVILTLLRLWIMVALNARLEVGVRMT